MKKATFFKLTIVFLISLLSVSFINLGKQHDAKLVGIWKGFEKDKQIEGVEKHWILQKFKNGTYVIMFTTKQDCEIETFTENGEWWTQDGIYYEKAKESKTTDSYKYSIENPQVVSYKSIELQGEKNDTYTFTDYKLE